MLYRSKLAIVAALAATIAWIALPAGANAQSRYRGATAFAYQSAEQNWRVRPSWACTYIGGPKGAWGCRSNMHWTNWAGSKRRPQ
jgi:hypothetical protein